MNQEEQRAFNIKRDKQRMEMVIDFAFKYPTNSRTHSDGLKLQQILRDFDAETKRLLIEQVREDRASKLARRAKKVAIKQGMDEYRAERFTASLDRKSAKVRANVASIQYRVNRPRKTKE